MIEEIVPHRGPHYYSYTNKDGRGVKIIGVYIESIAKNVSDKGFKESYCSAKTLDAARNASGVKVIAPNCLSTWKKIT